MAQFLAYQNNLIEKAMISTLKLLSLLVGLQATGALQNFNFPKIPNFFQQQSEAAGKTTSNSRNQQELLESNLLETISNTQYGKSATLSKQREVLSQVVALESTFPAPPINDAFSQVDGTWFLMYTSPGEIAVEGDGTSDDPVPSWKNAEENISSKKFIAKGSVSFSGVEVDVSRQPPKQIINTSDNTFFNEVNLENAFIRVGGPFRLSTNNERRLVTSINVCDIDLNFIQLDLSFLFKGLSLIKGTDDLGWLETTYLSNNVRVGRGNRGSMFILTRDEGAVSP